jgi:hypothetical protein
MTDDSDFLRRIANDNDLLTSAHLAVENALVEFRDLGLSMMGPANGFVIKSRDGRPSSIMRLGTRDGIRIALLGIADALETPKSAAPGA